MSERGHVPRRPSLPVTLPVLAAVLVAEAAVLRAGLEVPVPALVCGAAACAACVALALASDGRRAVAFGLVAVTLAGALAGTAAGTGAARGLGAFEEAMGSHAVSQWSLRVCSDPSLGGRGYRCRARATADGLPSGTVWLSCPDEPRLGDAMTCVGRFRPNGDDEWGRSSHAQGIGGSVSVARVLSSESAGGPYGLVLRLRERALGLLGARECETGALLAGSVCGYGAGMDAFGLDELFARCGVSHLVAVSGGHIAIVSTLVSALLEGLGLGPRVRTALLIGLSGAFVAFCGAPVSAVRSWLMVIVAFGAELLGRRAHALSAVCVVGAALALADPSVSGQLGFTLSVASVAALCVYTPYASYALEALLAPRALPRALGPVRQPLSRGLRSLRDTLAATLVAQAATAPLTIPTFSDLSLVAPVANLLLGLPFTVLIACGMLGCLVGTVPIAGPVLATVPLALGHAASWASLAVLGRLGRVPFACTTVTGPAVPVACVAALAAVYVLWPRVSRRPTLAALGVAAAALACVLVRWRWLSPARIVVLDVGQGDAILVQEGGSCVLVDAGPDDAVAEALAREHVLHLDAVLLTHLHADHTGGVDDLVGSVPCERVVVARGVAGNEPVALASAIEELTGTGSVEVAYGDVLRVGGFELEVVSPTASVSGEENADSLELAVRYERRGASLTALLTGDAERDETGAALARGDVGDIDFLKVGHHGSAVSLTEAEARALAAEVAVASAGEGNSYGHPTPECVEMLEDAGSLFLCTKDVGDVEVRPGRAGPSVRYDGVRVRGE